MVRLAIHYPTTFKKRKVKRNFAFFRQPCSEQNIIFRSFHWVKIRVALRRGKLIVSESAYITKRKTNHEEKSILPAENALDPIVNLTKNNSTYQRVRLIKAPSGATKGLHIEMRTALKRIRAVVDGQVRPKIVIDPQRRSPVSDRLLAYTGEEGNALKDHQGESKRATPLFRELPKQWVRRPSPRSLTMAIGCRDCQVYRRL